VQRTNEINAQPANERTKKRKKKKKSRQDIKKEFQAEKSTTV
jgi:hypothetical protein